MIAVDTNVVVRLLTGDDQTQYQKSLALFQEWEVFLPDTVIMETEWVLRYAYEFDPTVISAAFTRLFGLPNIHLSNPALMVEVLQWHSHGMDFVDALHLAQTQQVDQLLTFDQQFIRRAKGSGRCVVSEPSSPGPPSTG